MQQASNINTNTEVKTHIHAEKQYSIFQITLNLTIACLISGIILAATYYLTNPIAEKKAVELKNQAMKELVKDAESFKEVQGKDGWYIALKNNETIAYIVPVEAKGFGGPIQILAAISPEGKEIEFTIVSQKETPGLGSNADKDQFKNQFHGKTSDKLEVTKDPSNKENIQAMTGATITSRAVTKGIKEAEDEVLQFKGGK